mmetsp:Transcript_32323/g.83738  ORF Transcript_32323/g.83738 Transcript_32323/m.83738 type:complete len:495 (+) Transcript_32323:188-1672(+)
MTAPPIEGASPGGHADSSQAAEARRAKRQWLNAEAALKQKVAAAEKLATLPPDIQGGLEKERSMYARELKSEATAVAQHCDAVKRMVGTIQIHAAQCGPDSDSIEALAELLDKAENEIANVKDNFRSDYNALMDEEEVLSRDLEMFISRMASPAWDEAPPMEAGPSTRAKPAKPQSTPQRGNKGHDHGTLLPEVIAFEEFRAEFGDYGNWHPEEHKEFMRILKACRYDYGDAVQACCERVLVGFEREDVIAHARWHQEYADLEIRKRLALAEWKEARALQRRAAQESSLPSAESAQEAQEAGERKAAAERARRENQKQALEGWRRAKAEEAAAQAEMQRQREVAEKQQQAKEMEYRLYQKARLEEHHLRMQQQQPRQADITRDSSSTGATNPISAEQKKRIKDRERELQEKKARLLREKQQAADAHAERQKQLHEKLAPKIQVERDVGRLLSGTASTQRRSRATEEERAAGGGGGCPGFIRNVQRLGVPSYMRR